MRTYKFKRQFEKAIDKLPEEVVDIFYGKLEKLRNDFTHTSLRSKKIRGTHNPEIWEASINMSYRFTFHFEADGTIIFRNIGTHDLIDKGKY